MREPLQPRERWVRCSAEIVEQLSADWSPPVEVRIASQDGDVLELIFRTHTCALDRQTVEDGGG